MQSNAIEFGSNRVQMLPMHSSGIERTPWDLINPSGTKIQYYTLTQNDPKQRISMVTHGARDRCPQKGRLSRTLCFGTRWLGPDRFGLDRFGTRLIWTRLIWDPMDLDPMDLDPMDMDPMELDPTDLGPSFHYTMDSDPIDLDNTDFGHH